MEWMTLRAVGRCNSACCARYIVLMLFCLMRSLRVYCLRAFGAMGALLEVFDDARAVSEI